MLSSFLVLKMSERSEGKEGAAFMDFPSPSSALSFCLWSLSRPLPLPLPPCPHPARPPLLLVFFCMDFPSVYQEPRATPGQKELFKRRLQSVNVWYRRQSAQVWRHRRGAAVPWPGLVRVRVEGRLAEQLPRVRPRETQ